MFAYSQFSWLLVCIFFVCLLPSTRYVCFFHLPSPLASLRRHVQPVLEAPPPSPGRSFVPSYYPTTPPGQLGREARRVKVVQPAQPLSGSGLVKVLPREKIPKAHRDLFVVVGREEHISWERLKRAPEI